MFPIVHYHINKRLLPYMSHLSILGGLWPDLAVGVGMDRNQAHEMGDDFFKWCMDNNPEGKELAWGILLHGSTPKGVDYYADEFWPGYHKGWCFKIGKHYEPQVAQVTKLPENYTWWKSHNFVEMSYELITDKTYPHLKEELLEAVRTPSSIEAAAQILSQYTGVDPKDIYRVFSRVPTTFAIEDVSPQLLSQKQCVSFNRRFNHYDADPVAMAELLKIMQAELADSYNEFMGFVEEQVAQMLTSYL